MKPPEPEDIIFLMHTLKHEIAQERYENAHATLKTIQKAFAPLEMSLWNRVMLNKVRRIK